MKQPLQALLISPDYKMRDAIHRHKKEITIREGHRDYHEGPCWLMCHILPWAVKVNIIEVRHCAAGEITKEEWEADGFAHYDDMIRGMKKYYPSFNNESSVTVIKWEKAEGHWIENPDLYRDYAADFFHSQ
jgi:hypothetical protein